MTRHILPIAQQTLSDLKRIQQLLTRLSEEAKCSIGKQLVEDFDREVHTIVATHFSSTRPGAVKALETFLKATVGSDPETIKPNGFINKGWAKKELGHMLKGIAPDRKTAFHHSESNFVFRFAIEELGLDSERIRLDLERAASEVGINTNSSRSGPGCL